MLLYDHTYTLYLNIQPSCVLDLVAENLCTNYLLPNNVPAELAVIFLKFQFTHFSTVLLPISSKADLISLSGWMFSDSDFEKYSCQPLHRFSLEQGI
jgi:hypothetical protein